MTLDETVKMTPEQRKAALDIATYLEDTTGMQFNDAFVMCSDDYWFVLFCAVVENGRHTNQYISFYTEKLSELRRPRTLKLVAAQIINDFCVKH